MSRKSLEEYLAYVPNRLRRDMLDDRENLPAGGAAVIERLFTSMATRGEHVSMPSARSFREAASSEPTFRLLLRVLARYAPWISTSAAADVKAEWVSRPKPKPKKGATISTKPGWPSSWEAMRPALERTPIRASSRKRYIASIDRCAEIVQAGQAGESLGVTNAVLIADALRSSVNRHGRPMADITIANYLEALIALARAGCVPEAQIDGIRMVREDIKARAELADKRKDARLPALIEAGGFAAIAAEIGRQRHLAADLPDHSSAKRRALQTAVLLAVCMNKAPRNGDLGGFVLGEDLVRSPDGSWWLEWEQEKTGHGTEAGALWPEVCAVLDAHLLCGRPERHIQLRYRDLLGCNWLTLTAKAPGRAWPSALIKEAIGVPAHDLRTLVADTMRWHDPDTAANVISAHLGHKTRAAGEAYRTLAEGDAAARSWAEMRQAILQI